MKSQRIPQKLQPWFDARKRHRLSDARVQMARELALNPKKLGKLDNHRQEPWKAPLPEFIEALYRKQFGKSRPAEIFSLEQVVARRAAKKEARRKLKELPLTKVGPVENCG
jgi:hypothetical protein